MLNVAYKVDINKNYIIVISAIGCNGESNFMVVDRYQIK